MNHHRRSAQKVPREHVTYLRASAAVIHYDEALHVVNVYQVNAPLPYLLPLALVIVVETIAAYTRQSHH